MSLDHILLGILRKPESGYSLKQHFDSVFSHFWAAEISQIYRQLKSLEGRGFLESWEEPSAKGPPKRLYRTTSKGQHELLRWITSGPQIADRRVPYLGQLCNLHTLPDHQARVSFFYELREHFATRLQVLTELDASLQAERPAPDEDALEGLCGHMVLRHGIHRAQALLAWCDESIERLVAQRTQSPTSVSEHRSPPETEVRRPPSGVGDLGEPS